MHLYVFNGFNCFMYCVGIAISLVWWGMVIKAKKLLVSQVIGLIVGFGLMIGLLIPQFLSWDAVLKILWLASMGSAVISIFVIQAKINK